MATIASSISLLIVLALLTACGGSPKSSTSGPSSTPTPPTTGGSNPGPTGGGGASSCPSVQVAIAQGPTSGTAPFPAAAPVPPPDPGSTSAGSVCVANPTNGATVTSPAHVVASTTLKNIDHMRVYVDGVATQFTFYNSIDSQIWMSQGTHHLEILATDKSGNNASTSFDLTVSGTGGDITQIQAIPNWEPCSAKFPPGHPRAGQICAAGLGDAVSTMTENQSSPSLSGASAHFTMGGPTPYSNELWTKFLGGGTNLTHFTYDLYFMVDKPDLPQALEFDVNQAFNNQRWVFGTECNFKDSGKWDVWDGVKGWQPTSVPCTAFPANQWVHLVWQFERVGNQVHYISLSIDDKTYPLDLFYSNEPKWVMESVDVAFQMDGNFAQQPYNMWLDKVTLKASE
ncbi:MAG TPA: hypothetical protein VFP40_01580 [Terriglobales bacterium]|nr:hypothetical protein [Terriglobales bacterium]